MIHTGIHIAVADGFLHKSRIQASPDFGTDPCAVGVLPFVFVFAGKRRNKTACHIAFADAVFVPVRRYVFEPVFAEHAFVYVTAALHDGKQPDEL